MFTNDYGHKMKAVTCECQRILEVYKNKEKFILRLRHYTFGKKYSRMDQKKLAEDSL